MKPSIALMAMTHGRKDCIVQALESARDRLLWQFSRKAIIDDSADAGYTDWLRSMYGSEFTIHPTAEPCGFCGSIQRAWNLLRDEAEYIFHLEDDFVFNEQIKVAEMLEILNCTPQLAQVALLRQPWNPREQQAGGVIQLYADDFRECMLNGHIWVEHCRYFTTNPSLYPAAIARRPYPQENFCEGKFSIQLREAGYRFGILGRKRQQPKVTHIGHKRGPHWKWK